MTQPYLSVDEPPSIKTQDLYLWADHVELKCLLDGDHQVPLEESFAEFTHTGEGLGGEFIPPDESLCGEDSSGDYTLSNKTETRISDIRGVLGNRVQLFGESYPFIVENWGIKCQPELLTSVHELYIQQLVASNLKCINKSLASRYAKYFEHLAAVVIRYLFPEPYTIKAFGTSPHCKFDHYPGNFTEKMNALAKDIHSHLLLKDDECRTHSGDGGLDVVAWYNFDDPAGHFPVILIQAGCTADEEKLTEKSKLIYPDHWVNKFHLLKALSVMVTPHCYRNSLGQLPRSTDIGSVFIDRCRILYLLADAVLTESSEWLNALKPPLTIRQIMGEDA